MTVLDDDRIPVVQHMLANAGLTVHLTAIQSLTDPDAIASILDGFFALLCQIQRYGTQEEEARERSGQILMENEGLQNSIMKLRANVESLERQNSALNQRVQQTERTSKDDLSKALANNQANNVQYTHKLKRMTSELATLKERVQKPQIDQQKGKMRLANPLTRTTAPNPQMKKTKEEREKELLIENQGLRQALLHLFEKTRHEVFEYSEMAFSPMADHERKQFQMPLNMVWDSIQLKHANLLTMLSKTPKARGIKAPPERCSENTEALIFDLKKQADEYKRIIDRQNELLEAVVYDVAKAMPEVSEEEERLSEELRRQRDLLEKRQTDLEEERKKFTEAAVKLGFERSALQRERHDLETEKASFETTKLLHNLDMPLTPMWMKKPSEKNYGTTPMRKLALSDHLGIDEDMDDSTDDLYFRGDHDVVTESETFAITPAPSTRRPISRTLTPKDISRTPVTVKSALRKKDSSAKSAKVQIDLRPRGPDKENILMQRTPH
ncbi:hypothetical protein BC829DRAFT_474477 [Chytridium lagenaria]|nr:hypothetical protein BC829DRAFT_474477 [Chytridium lagenaria]